MADDPFVLDKYRAELKEAVVRLYAACDQHPGDFARALEAALNIAMVDRKYQAERVLK